ncbi:DNA repair and recombination protein RAD52 [Plectosphaerella cucumerina]|uniref:RAD52 homolog n=1 Tax=Plectosphaerella cucumerina TaxID=40658 RepID=A0A8K0X0Q3_9PEZI|nr:DNA repair and recombination protein RAD52 [Plectosphaerella cucumerina]
MPAPGDQHASLVNPFDEPQKRMTEYTAQQIATLQSRLEKQLGPEYLSSRSGPSGQKVHYIAAEKCIALANEVFGFNGWSSSIQNIQVDFVDEHPQTLKISLGLSVIVRVTLRDGTFHEDIGYGHIENCKGKAAAFEKAKKEGTTDALKRALRSFGNVLGNCIYDKEYLAKVTKIKPAPTKFDESRLHRHADYVKREDKAREDRAREDKAKEAKEKEELVKKEMADAMGLEDLLDADFDEADFAMADEGHPDEVCLPSNDSTGPGRAAAPLPPTAHMQPPARPMGRSASAGNIGSSNGPQTPYQNRQQPGQNAQAAQNNRPAPPNQPNQPRAPSNPSGLPQPPRNGDATPPPNAGSNGVEAVGFFSARAVPLSDVATAPVIPPVPVGAQAFNPKLDSPSIRKTPGIDHSSSKPVNRSGQHVPPSSSQSQQAQGGTGFTPVRPPGGVPNPALGRRIGAPGGPASPLANRTSYRPPTMTKRPAPQESNGGRPPLAEVTNSTGAPANGPGAGPGAAVDAAKRQRMS